MPFLDKLKNIFSSGGEAKKKSKLKTLYRQDVDPNEIWSIIGELGDGAFGKVYKAKQKLRAIEAALKQVEIKDEVELEEFSVEIEILSQCKHKNIVGLYEAYLHSSKLWMFIEFCGGGALDSIMVDLEKPLTEPQIQYVCRQMCEGLDFLHQCFVIHRDLKAGNVLLTSDGQVKLADFGVSAKNVSFRQTRDTFIGTPYWMAPEVILCETIKDDPYTFKADIWSLGITLIEFAEIQPPNYQLHPMRVLIKIQKAVPPTFRIPTKWSANFRDFITRCLVKDPDARPTMGELLEHDFIKDVSSNESIIELLSEVKAEVILEEEDLDDTMDDVDESSSDSPDGLFGTDGELDTDSGDLLIYSRSEENITAVNEETNLQDSPVAESGAKTHPFNSTIKANETEPTSTIQPSSQIDLEPASKVPVVSEPESSMTEATVSDISDGRKLVPGEPVLEKPEVSTTSSDDVLRKEPASVTGETSGQLLDTCVPQKFPTEASVADVQVQNASNLDEEVSVKRPATNEAALIQSAVELMPVESTLPTIETVPIKSPVETEPVESTTETVPIKSPVELVPIQSSTKLLPVTLPLSAAEAVPMKPPTDTVPALSAIETIPNHATIDSLPAQSETQTLPNHISMDTVSDKSTPNALLVEVGISTENQKTVEINTDSEEVRKLETTVEVAEDPSKRDELVHDAFGDDQESVALDNGLLHESLELSSNDEMNPSFGLPVIGNRGKDIHVHFSDESLDSESILSDIKNDSSQENLVKVCTENHERTTENSDDVSGKENLGNKDQFLVKADKDTVDVDARIVDEINTDANLTEVHSISVPKVSNDENKLNSVNNSLDVVGESDSKARKDDHVDVGEDVAIKKDFQAVDGKVNNGAKVETVTGKTVILSLPGIDTDNVSEKLGKKLTCNTEGAHANGSHDVISENQAISTRNTEISCVKKVEADSATKQPVISGTEVSSLEAKQRPQDLDSKVEISSSTDEAGKQEAKDSAILRYKPNKTKAPPANIGPLLEKTGETAKLKVVDAEMDAAGKKQITDEEELKKQFRTLTKTRKFVVNGVLVTSQTSRVVLTGTENMKHKEHELWKADLRELKRLQMEENRLLQSLDTKAKAALDELAKKQEADMQVLYKNYEGELETLAKQHQRILNKLVSSQNSEYKALQKKVKSEQEKDLKNLHESLKQDTKLWKQGIEMLPKQMRKDAMARRKEEKDIEYAEKERKFSEEQHEKSEAIMKRLTDQHQEKIVLLDKQFLQQKHHILQIRQERVTAVEERHMHEKYMTSKIQLQEKFILRRQLMMQRNNKEIEQMKRINHESQQKLMQSQALELRKLPKKLKSDTKTRQLIYKESLRISYADVTPELEKEKIKEFEENEKSRKKEEILRIENKHKRHLEALNNRNDKQLSELEEMHAEKQKMLSDHQEQKLLELEKAFESERETGKWKLESRNQALAEECCKEIAEHDLFYSQDNCGFFRHPSQRSLTGSVKSGSLAGSVKSGSIRGSLVM